MADALLTSPSTPEREAPSLTSLRMMYGRTASPWTRSGRHEIGDGRWIATSGYRQGPNQALVYAPSEAVLETVGAQFVEEGLPAVLIVAGAALGGWCRTAV